MNSGKVWNTIFLFFRSSVCSVCNSCTHFTQPLYFPIFGDDSKGR